jgi:hypothetical protein
MKLYTLFILFIVGIFYSGTIHAQDDKKVMSGSVFTSVQKDSIAAKDTTPIVKAKKDTVPKHDPRIATRRSAIIPGWGQAYNKQYWKIPLVYTALAIPVAAFVYNNSYYQKTKFAYEAVYAATGPAKDSSLLPLIDPSVKNLDGTPLSLGSYQNYRNTFRRNRDYSVLWFLIAWGVQVVDATVFAHLKQFDVSNDLSMDINPTFNPQTRTPALALTLSLKSPQRKPVITR